MDQQTLELKKNGGMLKNQMALKFRKKNGRDQGFINLYRVF